MRTVLISVAVLGVLTASASYASVDARQLDWSPPDPPPAGEVGGLGGHGVKLASAVNTTFLFVPEAKQSPLIAVGEGGEGGRGRRARKRHRRHYDPGPYGAYGSRYVRPYDRPYFERRPYVDPSYRYRPY